MGVMTYAPGMSHEIHNGDSYDFLLINHGVITYTVEQQPHVCTAGTAVLIQPWQQVHLQANPLEPVTAAFIRFAVSDIPADWPPPESWPIAMNLPPNDIIRPLFEYAAGHASKVKMNPSLPPTAPETAVKTILAAFVHGVLDREYATHRFYPEPVHRVLDWICELMNSCPGKKVTLEDLAEIGRVSNKHLCRLFTAHLGLSPMEVLILYRLVESLKGIVAGQKLDALAHDLGFANSGNLSRRFKQAFGKSPMQMRVAMAKGYKPRIPRLPGDYAFAWHALPCIP